MVVDRWNQHVDLIILFTTINKHCEAVELYKFVWNQCNLRFTKFTILEVSIWHLY